MAASVRGTAHVRTGTPCQDAYAFTVLADGTLLVAVADGLGSVAHAELGARRAVDAAISALRVAIPATSRRRNRGVDSAAIGTATVRRAFTAARTALQTEARERGAPLSAFATTLLVVAVTPGGTATVGQLGDGAIVTVARDGSFRRPVAPIDTGAANVVTPLTHPDALRLVQVVATGEIDAVVACTDGLEPFATDGAGGGEPYAPFLGPTLKFAATSEDATQASGQLADWLASPRITTGTDDDCTLLVAVRRDAVRT